MLKKVLIFVLICYFMQSYAQQGYFQVQVGTQFLRDKNAGNFELPRFGIIYTVLSEPSGSSTNFDISLTRVFDKKHGVQLGFGLFKFNSLVEFMSTSDDGGFTEPFTGGVESKNYSVYLGYRYSKEITSSWRWHINAGPIFAFNGESIFYFTEKYFSFYFKPGVQYVTQYGLVLECNGVLLRSLQNLSAFETGTFIPFQWGLDLRVGKEF
jgi:hypothetical protein